MTLYEPSLFPVELTIRINWKAQLLQEDHNSDNSDRYFFEMHCPVTVLKILPSPSTQEACLPNPAAYKGQDLPMTLSSSPLCPQTSAPLTKSISFHSAMLSWLNSPPASPMLHSISMILGLALVKLLLHILAGAVILIS